MVGLVVAAGAGIYLARTTIGVRLAQDYLAKRGIPSALVIDRLDTGGLAGRLRVGPADDPDLTAERIEYAARLINRIRETAEGFRRDGPFDPAFDVPFTTAQTGTIRGGTAINVVPQTCEFAFEFRNLPTVDPGAIMREVRRFAAEDLVPQMRAVSSEADIRFEPMAVVPALEAAEEAAVTRLVRGLTGDRAVRKVAYGAEAGQFQAAGVPAVLCGPGDIRQAHRPDEYVSLEQIARCEAFFDSLIPGLRR